MDSKTPELNISILSPYRGKGIGRTLLQSMFQLLKDKDYKDKLKQMHKIKKKEKKYIYEFEKWLL